MDRMMRIAESRAMVRAAVMAITAMLVAACQQTEPLDNGRTFDLQASATPAGDTFVSEVGGLLNQTSPSYVTLTVAEEKSKARGAADSIPAAVTSGSGFAAGEPGYVLTAAHVAVRKGYTVTARGSDGHLYNGKVIDVRPNNDMALIKLQDFTGQQVTPAAKVCLPRGADVFSLGKPHAQGDTVRVGQVEAMRFGRAVSYNGFGYPDAMVLRMNTQKGESGGPVFNSKGELAGMVVSTLSDGNGHALNLAHALPVSSLAQFLCGHVACSGRWQSLVNQDTTSCG